MFNIVNEAESRGKKQKIEKKKKKKKKRKKDYRTRNRKQKIEKKKKRKKDYRTRIVLESYFSRVGFCVESESQRQCSFVKKYSRE